MAAVGKVRLCSTGISPTTDVLVGCDGREEGLHKAMWTGKRGTLQMCSLLLWMAAGRG